MNQIPLLHITIQFSTYYEYPPFVVPFEGIKKHLNEEMIFLSFYKYFEIFLSPKSSVLTQYIKR